MKKFSLWKLVAAVALAGGGVVAACASHTTDSVGPQFPLDRYEQAQGHSEQLLRTAQAEGYARDAGVGSGSGSGSAVRGDAGAGRGTTGDAGARGGTGARDGGAAAPRTVEPGTPPGTPPSPGTTNPLPAPGAPISPAPSPSPTPTPPAPGAPTPH